LLRWLFVSVSCVAVVAYFQSRWALDFLNAPGIWPYTKRLNATFDDPNALACSLIMVFPMAILSVAYMVGAARVFALLASGASIYLLYVAASRTAFAGYVLSLVLIALALGLRALRNRRYVLLAVLVFLGVVVGAASVLVLETASRDVLIISRVGEMWDYLKSNWSQGTVVSQIDIVAYSRNLWWPSAIRMFKENLSSGVGIGVFQYETVNHGAPIDSAGTNSCR